MAVIINFFVSISCRSSFSHTGIRGIFCLCTRQIVVKIEKSHCDFTFINILSSHKVRFGMQKTISLEAKLENGAGLMGWRWEFDEWKLWGAKKSLETWNFLKFFFVGLIKIISEKNWILDFPTNLDRDQNLLVTTFLFQVSYKLVH